MQEIVDEALTQGMWVTCVWLLRGQEVVKVCPSICLAVTAVLSQKECEHAAGIIKAAAIKVLTKHKWTKTHQKKPVSKT